MKNIGLDIDDVICDFWDAAVEIFNRRHNVNASKSDFKTYTSVLDIYSISYPEFERTIIDEGALEQMRPYQGVPEIIRKLKDAGSNITLITSRGFHPNAFEVTSEFCRAWGIPYDDLHIKQPGKTKADYISQPLDLFVDDLPSNLVDLKDSGKVSNLALISQPWNRMEKRFDRHDHLMEVYKKYFRPKVTFDI